MDYRAGMAGLRGVHEGGTEEAGGGDSYKHRRLCSPMAGALRDQSTAREPATREGDLSVTTVLTDLQQPATPWHGTP